MKEILFDLLEKQKEGQQQQKKGQKILINRH